MSEKEFQRVIIKPPKGQPKSKIFDELLDFLLDSGNELATPYRWGSNPTGYFAILMQPIDFDLVVKRFEFPSSVVLNKKYDEIDYGMGTVIIRGSKGSKGSKGVGEKKD